MWREALTWGERVSCERRGEDYRTRELNTMMMNAVNLAT